MMNGYIGVTEKIPSKKDILWFDTIAVVKPSIPLSVIDGVVRIFNESGFSINRDSALASLNARDNLRLYDMPLLSYLENESVVELVQPNILDLPKVDLPEDFLKVELPTLENFITSFRERSSLGTGNTSGDVVNHYNELNEEYIKYLNALGLGGLLPDFLDSHPIVLRSYSVMLSTSTTQAVPMLNSTSSLRIGFSETVQQSKDVEIANLIINTFPEPTDEVTWEQVIDFRKDEKARFQLLELRKWMRKMTKDEIPLYEAREELEYLLYEYKQNYKLHKMKYRNGILSNIIKLPLALMENLIKLKLEKSVDDLFSLTSQKANLLETELKIPGKEVAYIVNLENLIKN